jgi:Flp pilus assembly protein TadB
MTDALDAFTTLCLAALAWLTLGCSLLLAVLTGFYFLARWGWRRLHSRQVSCYDGLIPEAAQEEKVP